MIKYLQIILGAVLSFAMIACGNYIQQMSTTQGSTAATVDANPGISGGMSVTSTLTPADETVQSADGTAITLGVPAIASGTGTTTFSTTPASIGQKVNKVLGTASNIAQQLNTGLQAGAPTASTILTMFHNQGDASVLSSDAQTAGVENAAIQALLANEQSAITASTATGATPTQVQAAVSAALSPAAIAAVVAPIQAASTAK